MVSWHAVIATGKTWWLFLIGTNMLSAKHARNLEITSWEIGNLETFIGRKTDWKTYNDCQSQPCSPDPQPSTIIPVRESMDLTTSGPTVGLLLAASLTPKVTLPFGKLGFALSLQKKKKDIMEWWSRACGIRLKLWFKSRCGLVTDWLSNAKPLISLSLLFLRIKCTGGGGSKTSLLALGGY